MTAFLAVFVMLGAGFTAIVLAVTHNRMLAELAVAFRTVTGTVVGHGADSFCSGRQGCRNSPSNQCRSCSETRTMIGPAAIAGKQLPQG
jgi:hypothetical protein